MHLLVTGATGFIGRSVVKNALARGHRVTALVRDPTKAEGTLPGHSGLHLAVCSDIEEFSERGEKYDALVHLAWAGLKYTDPTILTQNLPRQFRFLRHLAATGLRDMTLAGTCLEYGMRKGILSESDLAEPATYYGLAKTTLYNMLRIQQSETPGLRLKWLRYFYVYGVDQRPQSLYPQLLAAIARGDAVFPMSRGDQERDFIHVETLAHNTVSVAACPEDIGILNVGNGRCMRVADFVRGVLREKGYDMRLDLGFYPYPTYEPFSFRADVARLSVVPGVCFDKSLTGMDQKKNLHA